NLFFLTFLCISSSFSLLVGDLPVLLYWAISAEGRAQFAPGHVDPHDREINCFGDRSMKTDSSPLLPPHSQRRSETKPRSSRSIKPDLEPLEGRQLLSYTGPKQYAVDYNPTWPNWLSTKAPQLNDSDFANIAFKGLWGVNGNNQGRNDLATI